MAYSDVEWSTDDVIVATKLNGMMDNADHLRVEIGWRPVLSAIVTWDWSAGYATIRVNDSYIPDTAYNIFTYRDYDISGLAPGLHTITFGYEEQDEAVFRFAKTPDIDFLTFWFGPLVKMADPHSETPGDRLNRRPVTVVGTRLGVGWS